MPKENNINTKKSAINKKIVISFLILIIACPSSIFISRFIFRSRNKQYSKLTLNNITANYKINENLTLVNNIVVKEPKDNFYYQSQQTLSIEKIREGASKLGLITENQNYATNVYAWAKTLDLNEDRILFDKSAGTINIRYNEILNKNTTIDKNNAYKFITDYFNLGALDVEKVDVFSFDNGKSETFTYTSKYNGKKVYFNDVDDVIARIDLFQGKMIGAFFRVIPTNIFTKAEELKSIKSIDVSTLNKYYYTDMVESDKPTSTGELGADFRVQGNISTALKEYQECYFFHYDMLRENIFLVPSLYITGNYQDEGLNTGKIKLLVVNQEN